MRSRSNPNPPRPRPDLGAIFTLGLRALNLPRPLREYRFHPKRQWKFDYAWPGIMVAVEIEGGTFVRGRHVRPLGYRKDCQKYNEAALLGWKVIRGDSTMVKDGGLLAYAERALREAYK